MIEAGPLELIEHAVDLIEKIVVFDKVGKYPRHRDQRGLDLGRLAVVELLQFELQFGEQIKLVLRVADHHAHAAAARGLRGERTQVQTDDDRVERSEEHTSELQSLMRISYAVFC